MRMRAIIFIVTLCCATSAFASVGFQEATIPDPHGKQIAVGIWYPSSAKPSPHSLGLVSQDVAVGGDVDGEKLSLILISHGAYGSLASHYDTAIALAQAGFVVAALTHTGDNSNDQSYLGNKIDLIDRPRQVKLLLDWMLASWPEHNQLDQGRIGIFGFSLGGFTSLVEIGGTPELKRMALLCSTHPDAPECAFIKRTHGNQLDPDPITPEWVHDARIRAAVIVAPAVSFLFGPGDLKHVTIPTQLWRAADDTQAPDATNSGIVRKELPVHPEEHVVPGQDHYVFLAPCSADLAAAVPEICHDTANFDRAAFHRAFNQAVVTFFDKELRTRSFPHRASN
jgi:predicted dienelactone hydrolase